MLLMLVFALLLPAQRPADVVAWSASFPAGPVTSGGVLKVKVDARVQPGWKLYALEQPADGPRPLAFAVADGAPFQVAVRQIVAPKPKIQKQDANFPVATRYYENDVSFTIPVSVGKGLPAGTHRVPLQVTFQACGQDICLRPYTQPLEVEISIR